MWAASASAARCRASPTSSCRSWTSRRAARSRRSSPASTARPSAACGASRTRRSTRSRSGGTTATSSPPATPRGGATRRALSDGDPRGDQARGRQACRHVLGPDHQDRRQPRHLHEDRLRQPRGRLVQEHVLPVPRLQRVHEGQGPGCRPLIRSRICGICGDNHAVCSCYAQQMAYGVKPPPLAEWIVNLGEAAEYIFDHIIFQDNLVFVDFCEQMVRETTPSVWAKAESAEAPGVDTHGYKTIGDIMRSYNPFTGETYREALHMSRIGREMICLMEGRHVHPSTIYPGGVGTVATPTLLTDYLSRLLRTLDFIKKAVAMNDDVFDFFYEAMPGYEEVGRRRILLGCWGAFNNPDHVDYEYRNMDHWGNEMFVTPGVIVDGELVTTNLVDINLGIRIMLGSSYYGDWVNEETFVPNDPLGNPVDKRHPWNQ